MSDFAQELVNSQKPAAQTPPPVISGGPVDELPAETSQELKPQETEAKAPSTQEKKPGAIRIGTEVFNSPEEAMEYAAQLQLELAKKDAFDLGKQAALPKATEEAPQKDEFDELEDKLFENPKETLRKLVELTEKKTIHRIQQEKQIEDSRRQTWETFYSQNQDLSDNKDVVDFVLQKNWAELQNMQGDKALKILAEKTRSFLSSRKVSTLPTTELPSTQTVTTNSGGQPTAKVNEKVENSVDFISQINKHRKRG